MPEAHVPRITLDVIEAFALPTTSTHEVERAIAGWRFMNDSPIDFRRALMLADLTAADIVIVELSTERAGLQDIRAAFAAEQLAPSGLLDAIRLIAATQPSRWQAFQFVCLGSIGTEEIPRAPVVDCAGEATVVLMEVPLHDDASKPEIGWSDHSFALARHSAIKAVRQT